VRSWLASVRTVDEAAWFARDDLRPFGLMCMRMGWRLASQTAAAASGRLTRGAPEGRRNKARATAVRTEPRYRPGRAADGGMVTTNPRIADGG
jgi:hypothetical protein